MNPQDPLEALNPLRAPEAISWWPPAPGWWALLLAVLLTVGLAAYLLRRRYLRNAHRRQALLQLDRAQQAYRDGGDASHYLGQINALLKRVALLSYPDDNIAATHGAQWRAFINSSLPPALQLQAEFDDAAYRKSCGEIDLAQVHAAAQYWIRQHRAPR
jgi:Domain of unknown function (DUF4381)